MVEQVKKTAREITKPAAIDPKSTNEEESSQSSDDEDDFIGPPIPKGRLK